MKKKLLLILFFVNNFVNVFSEKNILIKEYLNSQMENLSDYQNLIYTEKIFFEEYKNYKNKWMPNFTLNSDVGYNYNPLYLPEFIHNFSYSGTLNLYQKIPLGINIDANLLQFSGILENKNMFYQFDYLGKLQISIPLLNYLFGFTDALIFLDKNESTIFNNYIKSFSKINKQQILNFLINKIGCYLYCSEFVNFYYEKNNMLLELLNDYEKMFKQGQISFSELIKIKSEYFENNNLYNNHLLEFQQVKINLENEGCDVSKICFNLDDWILFCESLENNSLNIFLSFDYEYYQLQNQWINTIKNFTQFFPNLNFTISTVPISKQNYNSKNNSSGIENFISYWGTIDSCVLNLSLSFKVHLMEYDDVYINKTKFELEKQKYQYNISMLSKRKIEEIERRMEQKEYYFAQLQNVKKVYMQENELLSSYESMYKNELLNKYDLLNARFYVKELYLNFAKKYLDYCNFILSFY